MTIKKRFYLTMPSENFSQEEKAALIKDATAGDHHAMIELARRLHAGIGLEQDIVEAENWLRKTKVSLERGDKNDEQMLQFVVLELGMCLLKQQQDRHKVEEGKLFIRQILDQESIVFPHPYHAAIHLLDESTDPQDSLEGENGCDR